MDHGNTAIFEEKKNIYEKISKQKSGVFNVPERKNNSLIISYDPFAAFHYSDLIYI